MGAYNMYSVMRSLDGVQLSAPIGKYKAKTKSHEAGDIEYHTLDAYALSLLLTIAYRQHDRTYDDDGNETNKDITWLCYGANDELGKIARVEGGKYDKCKKFLQKAGLITFTPKLRTRDFQNLNSKEEVTYTNVYRLNEVKLAECCRIADGLRNTRKRGRKSIPEDAEAAHQKVESRPSEGQSAAHQVGTNNTKKDNINSNKHDGVDDNKERELRYQNLIAMSLGVEREEIGLSSVRKYVLGKDPAKIAEIANRIRVSKGYTNKIGALFTQVRELPKADLTPEEMAAQFSEAMKLPTAKTAPADQCIEAGWNTLVAGLALEALNDKEITPLKEAFIKAIHTHLPDKRHIHVENFIKRIKRENGGSFEKLKADNSDIEQRVTLLSSAIEKEEK